MPQLSNLWQKDKYLNKDIEFIFGDVITEYDLQRAGFNIMRYFKLVDESILAKLESLGKKELQIKIGLLQKANPNLAEKLNGDGFANARKLLFEANELTDSDILAINKDAIFSMKECVNNRFDNLLFRPKNRYSSYLYMNRLQFYYDDKTHHIDVKGITDSTVEKFHEEGFLQFIADVCHYKETKPNDFIIKFIREFAMEYKSLQLPIDFYRELNPQSYYRMHFKDFLDRYDTYVVNIENEDFDLRNLDISYNYINYIIPLMSLCV